MNLSQARDIVRENCGRDRISEHILSWAMDTGRREVEQAAKEGWYWMKGKKDWSIVVSQQSYPITDRKSVV